MQLQTVRYDSVTKQQEYHQKSTSENHLLWNLQEDKGDWLVVLKHKWFLGLMWMEGIGFIITLLQLEKIHYSQSHKS